MSKTFEMILELIGRNEVRISSHGYDELAEDNLFVKEIMSSVFKATILEDYPNFHKGAAVLVLQTDKNDMPIHVVWGIPKDKTIPAVLITAYRLDSSKWTDDFKRRRK